MRVRVERSLVDGEGWVVLDVLTGDALGTFTIWADAVAAAHDG